MPSLIPGSRPITTFSNTGDGGSIKVFRGIVTMKPNHGGKPIVKPVMSHFSYVDDKDPTNVRHHCRRHQHHTRRSARIYARTLAQATSAWLKHAIFSFAVTRDDQDSPCASIAQSCAHLPVPKQQFF